MLNAMPDLDAEHYRKHSQMQHHLVQESLDAIHFRGNESILDVGCGDGRITADLAKLVPQGKVIGIDPSSSMIDLANSSFRESNLHFYKASAEEMEIRKEFFDYILIINALHWIRHPREVLHKLADSLKPDGVLFVLTFPKESPYWKFLHETARKKEWMTYQDRLPNLLSSQEYKETIEDSGLTIEESSVEEHLAEYNSIEELKNYIKGWLYCYLPLHSNLENRFLKQAIENAMAHSLHKEKIILPFKKLIIKAKKSLFNSYF